MKGLKARLLKKLQLVPTINSFRKGLVFHLPGHNSNQYRYSTQPVNKEQDFKFNTTNLPAEQVTDHSNGRRKGKQTDLDIDQSDAPRQDKFNKPTPNVELTNLPAEQVTDHSNGRRKGKQTDLDDQSDAPRQDNMKKPTPNMELKDETITEHPSFQDFEEKCPPGGEDSVVLYTTSLRGVRETFQNCSTVSYILSSFKILVHERDVSMDMEFRDELWRLFGEKVVPPKLFIKGRYIGGADEIIGLHEQGVLRKLLEGLPSNLPVTCTHCANMNFMVCPNCDGSRKVFAETEDDDEELCLQCPDCNENGLVKCPNCC